MTKRGSPLDSGFLGYAPNDCIWFDVSRHHGPRSNGIAESVRALSTTLLTLASSQPRASAMRLTGSRLFGASIRTLRPAEDRTAYPRLTSSSIYAQMATALPAVSVSGGFGME
jgi:hypothetical protein